MDTIEYPLPYWRFLIVVDDEKNDRTGGTQQLQIAREERDRLVSEGANASIWSRRKDRKYRKTQY